MCFACSAVFPLDVLFCSATDASAHNVNVYAPSSRHLSCTHSCLQRLMFLGMSNQLYTFTAFHAQAAFAVAVIDGRVAVPSGDGGVRAMLADTAVWQAKEDALTETFGSRFFGGSGGDRGGGSGGEGGGGSSWCDREDLRAAQHRLQHAYIEDAAALAGVRLRDDTRLFDKWLADRRTSVLTFRDQVRRAHCRCTADALQVHCRCTAGGLV